MKLNTNSQPSLLLVIIGLIVLMMVNFCLTASAQTTLLSENFESGSASWSFISNSGNGQNYWAVSNGSCSNGSNILMVRRNTDACVYRNNNTHNITASRQVVSTGYKDITLQFDWICNGQANADYGRVYYSFNGTTWTQLTTGGVGGIYQGTTTWSTQAAFALPTILEDTTFFIGFNWINNNSGGSFPALGVDNIVVKGNPLPVPPPAAPSNNIFSQNFSSGNLPAGWTTTDLTGTTAGVWSFNNPGARTINTTTAANGFAIFDSDILGQDNKVENAELVSPAFNCSTYGKVTLSLSHYFRFYANSNYRISVSGDNGANYTTLVFDSTETANAAIYTADISSIAAGKTQVRLKFTYQGSYSWYWAIDDILVTGQISNNPTWTGSVSTDWNTAANWSTTTVPTTASNVLIPATAIRMPTVAASTGAGAFNLTIETGATLTIATDSAQGGNFTITGNLVCNGSLVHSGSALMRLSGFGKTISGDFSGGTADETWLLESGASYTLSGNFTTYELRISSGATLNLNGYNLSVYLLQQYGTLNMGSSTLEIAGSNTIFTPATLVTGTGTIHFNSGGSAWATKPTVNQTVPSLTYYNLNVRTNNGFTVTMGTTAFQVANNLTILNPGTTGGVAATGADISIIGNLVVGSSTTNGVTFNVGHRVTGGGSNSALIFAGSAANSRINITYTDASLASFDNFEGVSTLNYPIAYVGTGTQMIIPLAYNNLSIGGTGTKALGDNLSIAGNLTLDGGTLTTAVSMIKEMASSAADVTIPFVNGGVATNNTVPTLASLAANATSMAVNVPAQYSSFSIVGIKVSISHTYNADLDLYLVSPAGTVYVVCTDNGGTGDNFVDARFSDSGTTTYPTNGTLNGNYRPEGITFSSLTGSKTGTWTLYVIDDANGDDGVLTDFKLQLQSGNTVASISVRGNWVNNAGTFTSGTGLVTFNGSAQQSITSRGQAFYQLTVNNAGGVVLTDDATVSNLLTLTNGVVSTGNNRLILTSTTTANLAGYSANSFVNGNLRRYIGYNTNTYALPVGNGTSTSNYRLAELQNNLLLGVSYIDASFRSLTNHNDNDLAVIENGVVINRINPAGVWRIDPNTQPTLGSYSIRLYTTGFTGLVDNEFVVLKRPSNSTSGSDWTTGGGLLNLLGGLGRLVSDGFALRTGLTSFSEFGIGDGTSGGSSLPIELLSFNAKLNGNGQVQLDWATAIEIENDYFTVERSADGSEFEAVATIAGAGNSILENRYQAVDEAPMDGLSYYRLKQTDFDGSFTYSPLRTVLVARAANQVKASVRVFPNPSNGNVQVQIEGISGEATLTVTDMQGRVVHAQKLAEERYYGAVNVNLRDKLLPGVYQLSIAGNAINIVQKIMIL